MESIFEVGYIVEPAKHRNIYRIVGVEICDTSLVKKKSKFMGLCKHIRKNR